MLINKDWLIYMTKELKLAHIDETMDYLELHYTLFNKEDWDKIYDAYNEYLRWEFNAEELEEPNLTQIEDLEEDIENE